MKQLLATIFLLVLFPLIARGDTIYFKDGTRLDVERVWEEDGQIKCDMYGFVASYPKEDIERIEREGSKDQDLEKYEKPSFSRGSPAPDRNQAHPDIGKAKSGRNEDKKKLKKCVQAYRELEGKIVIPVTLNGVVEASMALDTGASGMVISYPLAAKLGLFDQENSRFWMLATGIGGTVPVILTVVDSIQVKEIKDQFIPAIVAEPSSDVFEGLIGIDFLANYSCSINTVEKVVVFEEHPQKSRMIGKHGEEWWRNTFKWFSSQRRAWKAYKDYIQGLKEDSERLRTLRSFVDFQCKEVDKLFNKLDGYAIDNAVPMEWREY